MKHFLKTNFDCLCQLRYFNLSKTCGILFDKQGVSL